VEMEMPPVPTWFTGREAVIGFLRARVLQRDTWRLTPTRANGQPAVVVHRRAGGSWEPYGVHVVTVTGGRIARITAFNEPGLVRTFGMAAAVAD
jgi:hypothetical protein